MIVGRPHQLEKERTLDVLLSHGYFLAEDPHERGVMMPYPPLGLLYITAYLERAGFSVEVHDATFSNPTAFRQHLEASRPTVLGLYVTLLTRGRAIELLQIAKEVGCSVVLGGPEPGSYREEYLRRGADVVVIGEGEEALAELVPLLERGDVSSLAAVPGIAYLDAEGEVVATPPRPLHPNLDDRPWPKREAIDMDAYLETWRRHHGYSAVSMITARGCPFTCTWCSHSVFGQSHRRRSVADVADEVEQILERYAPDRLWYADDVFTMHRRWTLEYADELERRGLRIPFECISRADRLDDEVIQALSRMGCARLWIGAESGSQRILDLMKRKTKVEDVVDKTQRLQEAGIQVGAFIMLGYEGEERADIEATAQFLKQAAPDVFLTTVAYPIKGTPYYAEVSDRLVPAGEWESTTDRQLGVAGRRSRRYYEHATRWLVNDVRLHQSRQQGVPWWRKLRLAAARAAGRLGMWRYQEERETVATTAGRGWATNEATNRRAMS